MTNKEFMDKYGDYVVKFSHYYKYSFTFNAELSNGESLSVITGGNHDDIYRDEVVVDKTYKIRGLEPYFGGFYSNGKEVESFYDY